ncbi:bis(5'-nucleosyl)-tetraphosphatase (symmetrical) YqeK [Limnochorda pilosa]|uniref:bis(5'-nucleosyl)-tetraphosphatase (symmetrical) n=1 Tax=Limnochorda pilosa TaxID=1555112 RepID=A0A0K2SP54_LIMPI|nr:bis(5'-nucleosyl)-tetraphosphatase (symmetrical) YqeK [Limnochorda pilosa]BAS28604.1 phosphohydrolase [Limnochorda pilosa]
MPRDLYEHSLGVAGTARVMAARFGADREAAHVAGLLHDLAKPLSPEALLKEAERSGIVVDEVERANPMLLHGPLAAELVREELGIADEQVLDAIRYHTTGRARMGLLEMIVYTADLIEPGRSYPGVEALRKLAGEDLAAACRAGLEQTLRYCLDRGWLIHPRSLEARNALMLGGG